MPRNVDFPGFVADLIKGVFDAVVDIMRRQTRAFIAALKGRGDRDRAASSDGQPEQSSDE